jgi:hypothetical protein
MTSMLVRSNPTLTIPAPAWYLGHLVKQTKVGTCLWPNFGSRQGAGLDVGRLQQRTGHDRLGYLAM